MEYNKSRGGEWTDVSKLVDGGKAKIVDECQKEESQYKDKDGNAKTQNVAKVHFQGQTQPTNTRINWTTIYGLIDAFGKDSKDWIGKVLTVKIKQAIIGDTERDILYLIPEGFELAKNSEKKLEIRKVQDIVPEITATDTPFDEIPFN